MFEHSLNSGHILAFQNVLYYIWQCPKTSILPHISDTIARGTCSFLLDSHTHYLSSWKNILLSSLHFFLCFRKVLDRSYRKRVIRSRLLSIYTFEMIHINQIVDMLRMIDIMFLANRFSFVCNSTHSYYLFVNRRFRWNVLSSFRILVVFRSSTANRSSFQQKLEISWIISFNYFTI